MYAAFRRWHAWLFAGLLALGLTGLAGAQDDKAKDDKKADDKADTRTPEERALDQKLYEVLREVHNRGADLYNVGDAAACYHMFRGALLTARALFEHHPDIQKTIDKGLTDADSGPTMARRAFTLHELIETVRAQIKPAGKKEAKKPERPEAEGQKASLWRRLGGEENVKKVVDDFVMMAANDPKVNFTRNGKYKLDDAAVERLKKEFIDFISQASGGPYKYTGKSMKEAHQGMGITDAEFEASLGDLKKALEKNGAKAAEVSELLQAVRTARKDIVEPKKPVEEKGPEGKKPEDEAPVQP